MNENQNCTGDESYIGDFEIVKQIGSGSFSNVFLCKANLSSVIMEDTDELFIIKEINTNELVKKYITASRLKFSRKHRFKKQDGIKVDITPYERDILINTEQEYYYTKLRDLIASEIEIC